MGGCNGQPAKPQLRFRHVDAFVQTGGTIQARSSRRRASFFWKALICFPHRYPWTSLRAGDGMVRDAYIAQYAMLPWGSMAAIARRLALCEYARRDWLGSDSYSGTVRIGWRRAKATSSACNACWPPTKPTARKGGRGLTNWSLKANRASSDGIFHSG